MGNVAIHTPKGKSKKRVSVRPEEAEAGIWRDPNGNLIDCELELLRLLLPNNIKEIFRHLDKEVTALCGERYSRDGECSRWGTQKGSVYIGGQQVDIQKPRVRDANKKERSLDFYEKLQSPDSFDRSVFVDGLRHVSQRDYEKGIKAIHGSFGFKKSTVSKAWVRVTREKLKEMRERDISPLDIVSVFIDGKRFRSYGVVVALGVAVSGRKYPLGIFEADTENSTACLELLSDLEKRGLPESGLLFVVDGGSGLNKALESKYNVHDEKKRTAVRVRCHFHKMNNIEDALGKNHEKMPEVRSLFSAMRLAEDSIEARAHSITLEGILKKSNQSAHRSFLEAKSDLLTLHELELNAELKRFFSTTNPIENLNSLTEEDLRRVKRWRDSEHFQRWFAASAMNAEKRMRRVKGHRGLSRLKERLFEMTTHKSVDEKSLAA